MDLNRHDQDTPATTVNKATTSDKGQKARGGRRQGPSPATAAYFAELFQIYPSVCDVDAIARVDLKLTTLNRLNWWFESRASHMRRHMAELLAFYPCGTSTQTSMLAITEVRSKAEIERIAADEEDDCSRVYEERRRGDSDIAFVMPTGSSNFNNVNLGGDEGWSAVTQVTASGSSKVQSHIDLDDKIHSTFSSPTLHTPCSRVPPRQNDHFPPPIPGTNLKSIITNCPRAPTRLQTMSSRAEPIDMAESNQGSIAESTQASTPSSSASPTRTSLQASDLSTPLYIYNYDTNEAIPVTDKPDPKNPASVPTIGAPEFPLYHAHMVNEKLIAQRGTFLVRLRTLFIEGRITRPEGDRMLAAFDAKQRDDESMLVAQPFEARARENERALRRAEVKLKMMERIRTFELEKKLKEEQEWLEALEAREREAEVEAEVDDDVKTSSANVEAFLANVDSFSSNVNSDSSKGDSFSSEGNSSSSNGNPVSPTADSFSSKANSFSSNVNSSSSNGNSFPSKADSFSSKVNSVSSKGDSSSSNVNSFSADDDEDVVEDPNEQANELEDAEAAQGKIERRLAKAVIREDSDGDPVRSVQNFSYEVDEDGEVEVRYERRPSVGALGDEDDSDSDTDDEEYGQGAKSKEVDEEEYDDEDEEYDEEEDDGQTEVDFNGTSIGDTSTRGHSRNNSIFTAVDGLSMRSRSNTMASTAASIARPPTSSTPTLPTTPEFGRMIFYDHSASEARRYHPSGGD